MKELTNRVKVRFIKGEDLPKLSQNSLSFRAVVAHVRARMGSPVRQFIHRSSAFLLALAFFGRLVPSANAETANVYWWTYNPSLAVSGSNLTLKEADGSTTLHYGVNSTNRDGDVVQLGYFGDRTTLAPTATRDDPFKGVFIALTQAPTIGDANAPPTGSTVGEFAQFTTFTKDSDDAKHNSFGTPGYLSETISSGSPTPTTPDLSTSIGLLDTAAASYSGTPGSTVAAGYLAIRFWDVDKADDTASGGGHSNISNDFSSMYNTVTDVSGAPGTASEAWLWAATSNSAPLSIYSLHESGTSPTPQRSDLSWEFDNSTYNSDAVFGGIIPAQDESTSVTHITDGASIGASQFTGDILVSDLHISSGTIDAESGAHNLIINSSAGNTEANSLAADLSGGTLAGDDLGLIKVGAGDQKLSIATTTGGTISVQEGTLILNNSGGTIFTDDTIRDGDSVINIESGATLQLNGPVDTTTYEWARFLTGAGDLEFEGTGNHNIQLGLLSTDDEDANAANGIQNPDFSGTITTNNTNYIKVENTSGSGNTWEGHQVISGSFAGSGNLVKEGDGRLELKGNNSGFSGQFKLSDGTLILNSANALNGNGVDVIAGKVAIGSTGSTGALTTANGTGKTMIGGVGTYTGNITIDDADASQTFRELDPGIGPGGSLSAQTSPWHAPQGLDPDGNGAFDNIGSFAVTGDFTWNPGGIYNWEVSDFAGTAGTDWDLFSFNSSNALAFDSAQSGNYKIRVFGITDNAYSGGPTGTHVAGGRGAPANWATYYAGGDAPYYNGGTAHSGFKFLSATGGGGISYGGSTLSSDYTFDHGFFDIDDSDFSWLTQDWNGVWGVKYKHSDTSLYLVYSAVPEPSTYVMVIGAFFLPVWNFFRRRRSRRKEEE